MEIIHDDQNFTHEWLREGQVSGCVTTVKQALRGCRVAPLGAMEYIVVATPAFAQSRLGAKGPVNKRDGKQPAAALTAYNFREVPFVAFNRKDEVPGEFVAKAFGLKRVTLNQLFVPSSEGMVRAVLAGWGVGVVPRLLAQGLIDQGLLVNVVPTYTLPIQLYWHCWNLESEVLDALTAALKQSSALSLLP